MQLTFNEEQIALARTAQDFAQKHSPVTRFRALRDAKDPKGFTPQIFQQMAELGWLGVHIPEDFGGVDLGFAELAVILEALGRTLTPEPLIASSVLGGYALLLGGTDAQKQERLEAIAMGERLYAFAHQERAEIYSRTFAETRATLADGQWTIHGKKIAVLDGGNADDLIVVARVDGAANDRTGLGLFIVPANAAGVHREALVRIDHRNASNITFEGAVATEALGVPGNAADVIDAILDRGTIALCCDALGSLRQAFDISIQYLKERVQFGVPIGSFQALQHRAAKLFSEVELTRSIVLAAARAVDQEPERVPLLAAAAKATLDETFLHVAHEGVQFHGGVGVTDEYDIGLYLKRAHVVAATFGNAAWQRDRWASLKGY